MVQKVNEQLEQQLKNEVNIRAWGSIMKIVTAYGATGGGQNETSKIQKAIDAAIADGVKYVFFPAGLYNVNATSLTNTDKVVFIGDGASFVNGGHLSIFDLANTKDANTMFSRANQEMIIPANALNRAKAAIRSGSLKVAFWGDSITEGWDINSPDEAYAKRLETLLRESLPGVTVTVANYAIAGNAFGQAMDPSFIPYGVRSWANVAGKAWRDYVKDFQPDLIILAFGMNDAYGAGADNWEATNWQNLMTFKSTWSIKPSVVAVSTFLPTLNQDYYGQSQKETIAVSRTTREFAKNNGLALADVNRLYRILREGKDDVTRIASYEQNFSGFNNGDWIGDKTYFTLTGSSLSSGAANKFVSRNRQFYNGTIEVNIVPTSGGFSGSTGWINYREDATLGKMTVLVVAGATGQISLYSNATNLANSGAVNIPVGSASSIKVDVSGSHHRVYLNGIKVIDYVSYERLHDGTVGFGSDNIPPTYKNLKITYLDSITTDPLYTEQKLMGAYNKDNESGNGMNHPSGFGHAVYYLSAFYNVVRSLADLPVEEYAVSMKNPSLQSGWVSYGSSWETPGYYKDTDGQVHLVGLIKSGTITSGTLLFTLDAGDRPSKQLIKTTSCSNGASDLTATIWIYPDGRVTIGTVGGNAWLSLDGISSFRGES